MRGDDIDRLVVFERDEWTCGICHDPIDKLLRHPDPWAATIDHIIPLCQGGEHVWTNVQASHATCNAAKGGQLEEGTIWQT